MISTSAVDPREFFSPPGPDRLLRDVVQDVEVVAPTLPIHSDDSLEKAGHFTSSTWIWREEEDQVEQIAEATTLDAVVRALAGGSEALAGAAARLRDLEHLAAEDESAIRIDSAREMALFLAQSHGLLGQPRIAVNPRGLLLVEYPIGASGILAVEFHGSGLVRYSAVSAASTAGVERTRISGTVRSAVALSMISLFVLNL